MLKDLPSPSSFHGTIFWFLRWRIWPILRRLRRARLSQRDWTLVRDYNVGATSPPSKRALMSYLVQPFHDLSVGANLSEANHPNIPQSVEIANALNRLGYMVDVVDWQDRTFVPSQPYDLFFGMNENFGRILPYLDAETTKIYYATGTHFAFENAAEARRVDDLARRRGVRLSLPRRLGTNTWAEQADGIIVIGNDFVKSTYDPYNDNIQTVDNSALPLPFPDLAAKDFAEARRNFLWLGGTGLLHKGLDLLLDTFADRPDFHLWICGPLHMDTERAFIRAYQKELFRRQNIHPIGWIDVHGSNFRMLVAQCAYTIFPSCAEAMASSVLAGMSAGLIPVVSIETGIDIDSFGVELADTKVETIGKTVDHLAELSPDQCRHMAAEAVLQATTRYALAAFGESIETALRTVIRHA